MNVTLDFSSTFREEQEATGADECSEAVASSDVDASYPQIDADNTLSWVVDQLGLCNIPVSEDIIEQSNMLAPLAALLEEKCKVAAQNKKLLDDYSRVRTKLNAHIRDKQTHNEQLDAMRQEVRAAQGRVGALQQEQRESRNRWVEEKADLESKVFQMLAVQTQVQGSLRKKEKDHEKLQNQLAKAVREGNKSNKTMISISKPIKQNAHQLSTAERAEASAAALRAAEVASLRQYVHQLEQEKAAARAAHQRALHEAEARTAAAAEEHRRQCAAMAQEHEAALEAALTQAEIRTDGDGVDLNQTWNEVSSPVPLTETPSRVEGGSLVEEFLLPLTPVPRALAVMEEVAAAAEEVTRTPNPSGAEVLAVRQQLQEALAVIREQDRLIKEAIMGKLPSWGADTGAQSPSSAAAAGLTPVREGTAAACPDSIMKILAPGRGAAGADKENAATINAMLSPAPLMAALQKELFDEASPYTQGMLKATGMYVERDPA